MTTTDTNRLDGNGYSLGYSLGNGDGFGFGDGDGDGFGDGLGLGDGYGGRETRAMLNNETE